MLELKHLCWDIDTKVTQLANTHRRLREDFGVLRAKNRELKERIVKLEERVKTQSEQIVKYKLSEKANADGNYTDVKLKINELVREVDKCIGLLND
jgi:chromosome segregation ATPase